MVLGDIHVTTTADTIADTTEVATTAMTTETTTDHTGGLLHHTTEGLTGLGPDHGLTLRVATERRRQAHLLPKHRQEMPLSGLIDFRIDLLSSVC